MRNIFYLVCFLYNVENFSNNRCQCCNCCNEEAPITEEDKEITQQVLQHLKLDDDKLNNIINEVNNAGDNIAKINKIIEYTVDIDWDNPMCPNTLIKQENNACAIISHFHIMLNNPYFVKFFLICDKIESLHKDDTYMLNAMCKLVRWCVDRPSFNKSNMGSVEPILNALFIKENGEYFYCKKEKERKLGDVLYNFYHEPREDHKHNEYGSFLDGYSYWNTNICLHIDLNVNVNEIDCRILKGSQSFLSCEGEDVTDESVKNDLARGDVDGKKILGFLVYQHRYHYFAIINYNGVWYNKNTLVMGDVKKMETNEVCELIKKILQKKKNKEFRYAEERPYECGFRLLDV